MRQINVIPNIAAKMLKIPQTQSESFVWSFESLQRFRQLFICRPWLCHIIAKRWILRGFHLSNKCTLQSNLDYPDSLGGSLDNRTSHSYELLHSRDIKNWLNQVLATFNTWEDITKLFGKQNVVYISIVRCEYMIPALHVKIIEKCFYIGLKCWHVSPIRFTSRIGLCVWPHWEFHHSSTAAWSE